MANLELLMIAFDAVGGAKLYYDSVLYFVHDGKMSLEDTVIVAKDNFGNVTVTETDEVEGGEGARAGALAGALVGFVGGPLGALVGMAAGAAIGGLAADNVDSGIPDNIVEFFRERLKPGTSAIMLLVKAEFVPPLRRIVETQENMSAIEIIQDPFDEKTAEGLAVAVKEKRKAKHDDPRKDKDT